MYVNKCIKCGKEFETKNPKRVICPDCLYSDKKYTEELSNEAAKAAAPSEDAKERSSFSFGGNPEQDRPQKNYDRQYTGERPSYNRNNPRGGFAPRDNRYRPQGQGGGNFRRPFNNNNRYTGNSTGSDRRTQQRPSRPGSFQRPGGFNNRPQRGGAPRPKRQKQLLVSREQLEQIEVLYKKALPLPNPDVHEIIGQAIQLEPRKVFFGINLIRQKLMLPKLPFPKRKLAVSPDQMFAVKNLYEPLLPLPPIGCHKIIAAQLRMDEWRVHVAIGLIRKQMGLDRWNQDRADAPKEYKKTEQEKNEG